MKASLLRNRKDVFGDLPNYMVIGIDHGNSQIKTVHSIFVAGITEHGSAKPPLPTDILYYKNNYYTLKTEREPYKRDKTQDEKCFIMTLFGIAKEIMATNQYTKDIINVELAIGLPPEHFAKQKAPFSNYFFNHGCDWNFEYNNQPFNIHLTDVYIFPQAYSAIATRASTLKEFSTTYIIDIGGYTVDVLYLNEGRPDLQYCHSLELGIIQMNNTIAARVNTEYGLKISDIHINDVLLGKRSMLEEDIREFIKSSAEDHTLKILNTLREDSIDLKTNPAIFVGGGSLILKDAILDSKFVVPKFTEFIPEISANAAGYTALANGAIRKKALSQM